MSAKSKRGNPFAFVTLSDTSGQFETTVFSEALNVAREHLQVGALLVCTVKIERQEDQIRLMAQSLRPIDDVVAGAEGLRVFIDRPEACGGLKTRLDEVKLKPHQRGGEVSVIIGGQHPRGRITPAG